MMKQAGINMEQVKKQNRKTILSFLNRIGPISRKDIALALGLTPAAVTQICAGFIEKGILHETGRMTEEGRAGRKKILVEINYDYKYVFGIHIELEKTVIALTNLKGDVKSIREIPTNKKIEPECFIHQIAGCCKEMQSVQYLPDNKIAGAGIGIQEVTEQKCAGILQEEVAVEKLLTLFLNIPVVLADNITAFALAETLYGGAKKQDRLLFVRWSSVLESIVVDKRYCLKDWKEHITGIEHIIIDRNGVQCSCGRKGCLKTKFYFAAIKEEVGQLFSYENTPKLYRLVSGDLRNLTMHRFLEQQVFDDAVWSVLKEKVDLLAQVIVNTVTVFALDSIVLCGDFFDNIEFRKMLLHLCQSYDPQFEERKLLYTHLADRQNYIGPVAVCVSAYLDSFSVLSEKNSL